jgi:hypothetical protein
MMIRTRPGGRGNREICTNRSKASVLNVDKIRMVKDGARQAVMSRRTEPEMTFCIVK